MALFKYFALVSVAVSSFAAGSAITPRAPALILDLTLAPTADNAKISAILTNTGNTTLNLLKYGTFLDSAPVEKVAVFSKGKLHVKCWIICPNP
jgi:deuterolysin